MAEPKRKRPRPTRKPRPTKPVTINKAPDLLPHDDVAQAMAWLGTGYPTPKGPPWPWEALAGDERDRYEAAVKRLTDGFVPALAAQVLCWSGGRWRETCRQIVDAAEIQIFPERQHIRLIPRTRVTLYDPRGRPLLPN